MTRTTKFFIAFSFTLAAAAAVNVVPYVNSRGAYRYDGQQVAGFPFAFHRIGGDCFPSTCETYALHAGYLLGDIAIGVACALGVGFVAASIGRQPRRT